MNRRELTKRLEVRSKLDRQSPIILIVGNLVKASAAAIVIALVFTNILEGAEPTMLAAVPDGDGLKMSSVPMPSLAANQVLIKVHAAGANPVDWRVFKGPAPSNPPPGAPAGAPAMNTNANNVPGFDAAGVIAALGSGAAQWKVGDEVVAFLDARGAYAQYAAAPVDAIVLKPKSLSFEQAAGIPTVAYAAWATMVDVAHVHKGQRVLVHGAAGGVGSAAVQIAKARGAYVIATASKRNHDYLRSIGVDETIDYTTEKFEDKVKDIDIVMNTADADTANRSIAVVKKGGMLVTVAGRPDAAKCEAAKITCGSRTREGATPIGAVLKQIADWANAGKYQVNVDQVFPLAEAGKAWEQGRAGHTRGKLVISIPQ